MKDAKIAVYSVEVETTQTENKGTVLIESSEQLLSYNRSEEIAMEKVRTCSIATSAPSRRIPQPFDWCGVVQMIKSIVDCGANVIITGSKFSELAMHYCERYGVLMLKVSSNRPLHCCATRAIKPTLTLRFCPSSKYVACAKPLAPLA
eukprot:COSAG05_NODE_3679_length_1912_cov_1.726972_2_plen_148_part_00